MNALSPFFSLAILGAALSCAGTAAADPPAVATTPHPVAYAILVGSNVGGPGQNELRYAEDDARRVGQVLRELGRYGSSDLRVLVRPDPAQVLATIDDVGAKVRATQARGEQAVVLFYYSGHARADAVSLGGSELPLATLREKLRALPSTLTIVVLDACQSGSFARIKGAEPAADFSFNSVSRLTTKGIAVMASSTAEELSQESDELKSSYFTHHLLVALRGAGDADGDGRVSLDEAYRYAYRRTLAATARTQVGGQHVTLDTDLSGQGDVPVTYPSDAKSQLEIPGSLDARILVVHRASGSVVAELQKAAGPPIRLAFTAGGYDAIVRQPRGVVQCRFALADDHVTSLDLAECTPVASDTGKTKGDEPEEHGVRELDRWRLEAGAGFIGRTPDAYTQRLNDFGYKQKNSFVKLPTARLSLGVSRSFGHHLGGLLQFNTLAGDTYERDFGGNSDTLAYSAYAAAFYLRAQTDVFAPWLGVYAQAGAGLSLGVTTLTTSERKSPEKTSDSYVSYVFAGAIGLSASMPRHMGFFLQAGYDRAPVIANLLHETHDSGGPSVVLGFRFRLGEDR